MFRRTLAAAAVAALAAAITPAQAADDVYAGFTCGFASTNDPTGQVIQDPNTQTGVVTAGPFAATDAAGTPATRVTITCTFQLNQPNHGGTGVSRSSSTAGAVGVLADTITYTAVAGDDVYLCTSFTVESSKGTTAYPFDDDQDATNGNQCALATSVEA